MVIGLYLNNNPVDFRPDLIWSEGALTPLFRRELPQQEEEKQLDE